MRRRQHTEGQLGMILEELADLGDQGFQEWHCGDVAREDVGEAAVDPVLPEAFQDLMGFFAITAAPQEMGVACVVAQLAAVDRRHLAAQQLQREGCRLVAHVAVK